MDLVKGHLPINSIDTLPYLLSRVSLFFIPCAYPLQNIMAAQASLIPSQLTPTNLKLVSRDPWLCLCRHTDFVTALDFHPADDKFFLSGSIDGKVLLFFFLPNLPLCLPFRPAFFASSSSQPYHSLPNLSRFVTEDNLS